MGKLSKNKPTKKNTLVARYLYEHLFLGHLYFSQDKDVRFLFPYKILHPQGEEIDPVKTELPTGDPKKKFYYRFKALPKTIDKNHIIYPMNQFKLHRIKKLVHAENVAGDKTSSLRQGL